MGLTPYPYQIDGRNFLIANRRAYLGDVMRLGKSVQAILAASEVLRPTDSVLVVCPASAVPNWRHEWEKWGGPPNLDVVSYNRLTRQTRGLRPNLVILDEAHYCKTPSAKRTRAALGLAAQADRAWLLSGTPMPNHPGELWAPIKYLWPEIAEEVGCRTAQDWLLRYCKVRKTRYGLKPYGVRNGAELRRIVRRIMLRRTLDDVSLQLPPLRVDLHRLPDTGVDLSAYAQMDESEEVYASSLRQALGVAKAPAVARQIIEELNDRQYFKIVVLYYHRQVGDILRRAFTKAGFPPVGFGGSTPQSARWQAVRAFQEGDAQVFLAQQVAAGIAIDLSAADEVVLVEPAWTPDENSQAVARVRSLQKNRPCRARIFTIPGTIDSRVMSTIRAKVRMREEIFDRTLTR